MLTIYTLKPAFQNLLRPAVRFLAQSGITANQVTLSTTFLSVGAGTLLWLYGASNWPFLLMPVFLFVRMALNAVDGMLAREFGQKSRLGAFLNELGDVVSDCALFLPFALLPGAAPAGAIAVALLAVISEMAGVLGLMVGAQRRYDGPMGKSDRAFVFGAVSLAIGLGAPPVLWLDGVWSAVSLLLIWTIVNRVRNALREGC